MECPSCNLRYNCKDRKPLILKCGHSLCSKCFPEIDKCPSCSYQSKESQMTLNYSLLEFVQKQKKNIDKFLKVCFVGGSGVGKTSIIRMLTGDKFIQEVPTTIGYDFTFQDRQIKGYTVRYQLWDSAGQQRYKAISPIHYKNADIVVIVYDVTLLPENNKVQYWIKQAQKNCSQNVHKIVIGNKLDLIEGKLYRPLDDRIWQLIKDNKMQNLEISCKMQIGIQILWKKLEKVFTISMKSKTNPQSIKYTKTNSKKNLNIDNPKIKKKSSKKKPDTCC